MAEQAHAQVGVRVGRADGVVELGAGEERVQALGGVVRVRVGRVGRLHVVGEAGEPGALRGKVLERDLALAVLGQGDALGKVLPHRVAQLHLAARSHLGEQRARERLRVTGSGFPTAITPVA